MSWISHHLGSSGWRRIVACLLLPVFVCGSVPAGGCCCGSASRLAAASSTAAPACCNPARTGCAHCRAKARTAAGLCRGLRPAGQSHSGQCRCGQSHSGQCRCGQRGDSDVPKQISPVRSPVSERAVCDVCQTLSIGHCGADEFARRWKSALGPPARADRVIALCRLVI
jgi:hypothetical protein